MRSTTTDSKKIPWPTAFFQAFSKHPQLHMGKKSAIWWLTSAGTASRLGDCNSLSLVTLSSYICGAAAAQDREEGQKNCHESCVVLTGVSLIWTIEFGNRSAPMGNIHSESKIEDSTYQWLDRWSWKTKVNWAPLGRDVLHNQRWYVREWCWKI